MRRNGAYEIPTPGKTGQKRGTDNPASPHNPKEKSRDICGSLFYRELRTWVANYLAGCLSLLMRLLM
jgi:hypothetical protein